MAASVAQKVKVDINFVGMMLVGMRDTLNLPGRVRGHSLMLLRLFLYDQFEIIKSLKRTPLHMMLFGGASDYVHFEENSRDLHP